MLKKTHTHTVSLSHTHSVKLYLKSFIDLPSVKLISFSSLINADRYPHQVLLQTDQSAASDDDENMMGGVRPRANVTLISELTLPELR